MQRISWNDYAMRLATTAALRSEDPYVKVGAVVFRPDNTVAGVGYNGAPPGVRINWTDRDKRRPRVIHAEANALRWTSPREVNGGWIACTLHPCSACLALIASYGIARIAYSEMPDKDTYDHELLGEMCRDFGIIRNHVLLRSDG